LYTVYALCWQVEDLQGEKSAVIRAGIGRLPGAARFYNGVQQAGKHESPYIHWEWSPCVIGER
jgi:hypothetical protein